MDFTKEDEKKEASKELAVTSEKKVVATSEKKLAATNETKEDDSKIYESLPLSELGANLPIGFVEGGTSVREIATRPFTMKQERLLGSERDKNRQLNVAKFVSFVISNLCTRLGPHLLEPMPEPNRQVITSQMYMADIYYAYIWIRIQAIGEEMDMEISCSNCRHEFDFIADLSTTDIRIPKDFAKLNFDYKLKHPFTLRNKPVEVIKLGPARWSSLEILKSSQFNTAEAKLALIRGSIEAINEVEHPLLGEDELDDMSKYDLESIAVALEDNRLFPDMTI